jgi:hypothetical protein
MLLAAKNVKLKGVQKFVGLQYLGINVGLVSVPECSIVHS